MSLSAEQVAELHQTAQLLAADELPQGWDIVPGSANTRVAHNAELQVYYKEYHCRSPFDSLKGLVLGSPATRARKSSEALHYVGIGAPVSLAWGKLEGGREYLFTQAARGQDVAKWLGTTLAARTGEQRATRRQLLEGLGVFVGRVHATGFIPGDLKPGNIMADLLEDRFQFALINNDHTIQQQPPPGLKLLRNLMELNLLPPSALSRTDRMRFFVAWRRQMRELSPIEAKVVAADAYQWAMQLMYETGQL